MSNEEMRRHPLSACYWSMSVEEFSKFADDIAENGLLEPITLLDGMVLDGWHRYSACLARDVEPVFEVYSGSNPVAFVESKNEHRRHGTAGQRAASVAAVHDWWRSGENQFSERGGTGAAPTQPKATTAELAAKAGVSERTMRDAKVGISAGRKKEMINGSVSPKKAAAESRNQVFAAKPKPSKEQKLKGELDLARAQITHLEQSITDLTDELNLVDASKLEKSEQIIELEKARHRIRTLESQCREYQNEANQWKREAKALRKKVGQ